MRILSGIQPSGRLHVGNYFGAMRQHLALQAENEAFYFMASYHALTTVQNPKELRALTLGVAADYLALGLDPTKTVLFTQQDVPEVTELTWMFSCVTPMGLLERATSYKDKVAQGHMANHGLFAYPVLQAADILIYLPDLVPVGQDQIFKIPDAYILESTAVVPGLDGKKMSKSYGNDIGMFEEGKALRKKVMGIVTDSTPVDEPKDPETSTPLLLLKLMAAPDEIAHWEERYRRGGMGYGEIKQRLYELLDETFAPFRDRRKALEADPGYVQDVLRDGGLRARAVAHKTMERVREAVGLPISYTPAP
jgi:tryptophanyl-tRNA synthetase